MAAGVGPQEGSILRVHGVLCGDVELKQAKGRR
jgi:hypothetical protein